MRRVRARPEEEGLQIPLMERKSESANENYFLHGKLATVTFAIVTIYSVYTPCNLSC